MKVSRMTFFLRGGKKKKAIKVIKSGSVIIRAFNFRLEAHL